MKGDDEGGEADEEKKGTRRPRWADWDGEEEEEVRQRATEEDWHKTRNGQGIVWLDYSDEEEEGEEEAAGGRSERCEVWKERVSGRVEMRSEENEECKEDEENKES